MGQDTSDRDEQPGSTPEPFEVFYLREYPKVVGLLYGLLGSRLVAEDDSIKLADDHAEVWQAIQARPTARYGDQPQELDVNIDDRLRAASKALKDCSVAQVDATSQLLQIVRPNGQHRRGHPTQGPDEGPGSGRLSQDDGGGR